MSFKVISLTVETDGLTKEQLEEAKVFCGKNAGICYQRGTYSDSSVSDPEKARLRFPQVSSNGHHSIADHVRIEVLFENISKMLAIVLNSLQDYSTSEKSGRYTVMTGNSLKERDLYNKWLGIFNQRILELEPTIDDDFLMKEVEKKYPDSGYKVLNGHLFELEPKLPPAEDKEFGYWFHDTLFKSPSKPSIKLAQENARYVLSVFTRSTTMGYSTSVRQWNYIYDWCLKYLKQFYWYNNGNGGLTLCYADTTIPTTRFEYELYNDLNDLAEFIKETLYVQELRDNKDRCFEFLTQYSGNKNHPMAEYDLSCFESDGYTGELMDNSKHSVDDILDVSYQVAYLASFVHIAQAERHRTLKYFMVNNFSNKSAMYFIPPMLEGTKYVDEWLEDLKSIADKIPQATLVAVIESGHISDFILKCKERLCGRAQWEIMNQTKLTAQRFIDVVDNYECSKVFESYVNQLRGTSGCTTKCALLSGTCKEPCRCGAKNALDRKF